MKKITIAFDLDNTLCQSIRRYNPEDILKVKPIKKVLKILKELKYKGYKILIFTRRDACGKNARKLTKQWLKLHDIPYDELITSKPHFDILIDDRAFNPYQSCFINARRIELECDFIWQHIKKNIYNPKKKGK